MMLLASLVCWLSWVLERACFIPEASGDVLSAPLPRGAAQLRNVPPAYKTLVSREAALGKLGKSPRAVLRCARRFAGKQTDAPDPGSHNWFYFFARQLVHNTKKSFAA
eukprot:6583514-Alexandrium_andersonii.AAC.1